MIIMVISSLLNTIQPGTVKKVNTQNMPFKQMVIIPFLPFDKEL